MSADDTRTGWQGAPTADELLTIWGCDDPQKVSVMIDRAIDAALAKRGALVGRVFLRTRGERDGRQLVMVVGTAELAPGTLPDGDCALAFEAVDHGDGVAFRNLVLADINGQIPPGMTMDRLVTSGFVPDVSRRLR